MTSTYEMWFLLYKNYDFRMKGKNNQQPTGQESCPSWGQSTLILEYGAVRSKLN